MSARSSQLSSNKNGKPTIGVSGNTAMGGLDATPPKPSIRNLPVSLFGAVMGLSGLSLAWRFAHQNFGAPQFLSSVIALISIVVFVLLVLGYLTKSVAYPDAVVAEFKHPVTSNFFGTFTIALLLLSAIASPVSEALSVGLWIAGVLTTFVLGYIVISRLLSGGQDPTLAIPAWLIPGVATLDIAIPGSHMPMSWAGEVNLLALAIGAAVALVFFVMIFARLVNHAAIAPAMMPSLMILIAPFEVGFLAYTSVMGRIDAFASVLFYAGLFLFLVVVPKIFRRSNPFTASWWAISFPTAALVNAALTYAAKTQSITITWIAWALLVLLTGTLLVLLIRTIKILLNGKLLSA
ncbi:SLAC1 anion channel family protein [Stenotrophomonas maltophilia]|nr:SLAC1 anion channel family protein [Stenotrophomonas maltophilia]